MICETLQGSIGEGGIRTLGFINSPLMKRKFIFLYLFKREIYILVKNLKRLIQTAYAVRNIQKLWTYLICFQRFLIWLSANRR